MLHANATLNSLKNAVKVSVKTGKSVGSIPSSSLLLSPRHFYAMYSLIQRDIHASDSETIDSETTHDSSSIRPTPEAKEKPKVPAIFTDPGYNLLGTSVLSTSNCGNPALRLFGFGPVTPEGYGIGPSLLASIKLFVTSHRIRHQRRRYLNLYVIEAPPNPSASLDSPGISFRDPSNAHPTMA